MLKKVRIKILNKINLWFNQHFLTFGCCQKRMGCAVALIRSCGVFSVQIFLKKKGTLFLCSHLINSLFSKIKQTRPLLSFFLFGGWSKWITRELVRQKWQQFGFLKLLDYFVSDFFSVLWKWECCSCVKNNNKSVLFKESKKS